MSEAKPLSDGARAVIISRIRNPNACWHRRHVDDVERYEATVTDLEHRLAEERQRREALERDARAALAFAVGVIKAGEPWTGMCEMTIGTVLRRLEQGEGDSSAYYALGNNVLEQIYDHRRICETDQERAIVDGIAGRVRAVLGEGVER